MTTPTEGLSDERIASIKQGIAEARAGLARPADFGDLDDDDASEDAS